MKERVKSLRRYQLYNKDRRVLCLFLGQKEGHTNNGKDKGFRWMFVGSQVPMPVRKETWFNGFPADTMLDWLKKNGWYLYSVLDITTNRLTVYKPVCITEASKGNDWIPVSSGMYPENGQSVEVTYLSSPSRKPMCSMAYRTMNTWHWSEDGTHVKVEIIAWKPCKPYKGNDK